MRSVTNRRLGLVWIVGSACGGQGPGPLPPIPPPDPVIVVEDPPALRPEEEVPGTPVGETPERPVLRVCTWNIQKLGFENKPPRRPRSYSNMAAIIKQFCDVVGVVEVMATVNGKEHPGYDELTTALGVAWRRSISAKGLPGNLGANDEKYAFFWRRDKAEPCAGAPRTFPDAQNVFMRDPAVACFVAPSAVKPGMDFLLALYHAPNPDNNPAKEMVGLPALIAWMQTVRAGEGDLFIAGDFNLRPNALDRELAAARGPAGLTPKQLVNVFGGSRQGTTIDIRGEVTANHYDHFVIVFPERTQERRGQQIIDPRSTVTIPGVASPTAEQKNRYYGEAVSDHLMVRVEFDVGGPDDD